MEKKNEPFFDKFKSLEKLIYSVKYLPQILFFGGLGIFLYVFFIAPIPILKKESVSLPFTGFCLYITLIAMKNYRTKREFGGKGCWKRYSST